MLQAALEASRVLAAQEARAREAVARWRRESDEQRRLERATQESLARAVVVEIEISPAEHAAQDQEGRLRRHLVSFHPGRCSSRDPKNSKQPSSKARSPTRNVSNPRTL
jgi:hypothetical protein